jgi:cysteine desulfurase / selenocysteine lyase
LTLDLKKIREDFPIVNLIVNDKPYIYLDNAATTQKPVDVVKSMEEYYYTQNSNIHRGTYYLSNVATKAYEDSRTVVKEFLNASSCDEIVFTKGTTDAINLVANTYAKKYLKKDDEIIISTMEHHSNIVPWQMIAEDKGANVRVIPITDSGEIIFEEFEKLINEKTKLISVSHISNVLGTVNPVKRIIEKAHKHHIPVLVDGAQSVAHMKVDVQELDCDFFAFSGHKIFGPTGIGVLYGKKHLLEDMPPYQGGGEMIDKVTFEKSTYNDLPHKFEAGTPNICGVIGLGVALKYVINTGIENIAAYESELLKYATTKLSEIEGMKIIGTAPGKASVISFVIDGTHPMDLGMLLDKMGVAVRVGNHCAQPLMARFNLPGGTVRASFAFYNTKEEVEIFVEKLKKAISMLK